MFTIKPDKGFLRAERQVREAQRNLQRAVDAFLVAVAEGVREELQRAPGAEDAGYRDLEVVMVPGLRDKRVVALVSKSRSSPVRQGRRYVVKVLPRTDSAYLRRMASKGWWPSELLPKGFERTKKARLVSRDVTPEESQAAARELLQDRWVREELVRMGVLRDGTEQEQLKEALEKVSPPGLHTQEDLAWRAIRSEHGLAGEPRYPAWRKALQARAREVGADALDLFWGVLVGEQRAGGVRPVLSDRGVLRGLETFQAYLGSEPEARRGR